MYEGDDLIPIMPDLGDGAKEHMFLYQDESTVHANEYQSNFWLAAGEQVLKIKR